LFGAEERPEVCFMKKILVFIGLLGILMVSVACGNSFEAQRSATVDYLKAYDSVNNDLTDTVTSILTSIGGGIPNLLKVGNAVDQITAAAEGGQQRLLNLKVPDIPEVKAQNSSAKNVIAL
jgi:hypothetical protein